MRISILIPCFNEEATVAGCISSILAQERLPDEIIAINDGSTDGTRAILESFGSSITIVDTPANTGAKSHAQEYGLRFVTGEVLVMTDADTILAPNFIARVEQAFADPAVSAFAGYIKSMRGNWLTACRELDYVFGQDLHKRAQSYINALLVIPGCAAAFRTADFMRVATFEHDTITEDLDITYKFHKEGLRIAYDPGAVVYTQDPTSLTCYIKQMRRWVSGGWQNLLKHRDIVQTHPGHAFELMLTYAEGFVFGLVVFILPFISLHFFVYTLIGYWLLPALIACYAALARRRFDLLWYAPVFPLLLMLNTYILIEQFVKVILLRRTSSAWYKPARRALLP
jgi:cellulose synthase/poly-beta-1,6-N-acetylglucosamine synthase-like glycosyltransferase